MFIVPELKQLADDIFSLSINLDCFEGEDGQDLLADKLNRLSEKVHDIIYFVAGEDVR